MLNANFKTASPQRADMKLTRQLSECLPSSRTNIATIEREGGRNAPASPTTQCGSKKSLRKVSQKREYSARGLETFGRFSPKLPNLAVWRLTQNARNPRKLQGFGAQVVRNPRSSHCVADHEGIELPHSRLKKGL
jgi:hypothetical protein